MQRWERELRMPVRRPKGTRRSAVIALKQELDAWLQQAPMATVQPHETRVRTERAQKALELSRQLYQRAVRIQALTAEAVKKIDAKRKISGRLAA